MLQSQQHRIQTTSVTYTTTHGNAGILNPMSEARDQTTSFILVRLDNHWATRGTPQPLFFCLNFSVPEFYPQLSSLLTPCALVGGLISPIYFLDFHSPSFTFNLERFLKIGPLATSIWMPWNSTSARCIYHCPLVSKESWSQDSHRYQNPWMLKSFK